MRKLKIDLSDLEMAFTTNDEISGMESYLDLESGRVVTTSEDDRSAVETFFEETESEEEDTDLNEKFEKWLEEYKCPEWQVDSIRDAFLVEHEYLNRFIHIPKEESRDGYRDMVDFAETITNARLREMLFVALDGKGAFRRFKNVLHNHPQELQRYYQFSDARLKERMLEWLAGQDIELEQ